MSAAGNTEQLHLLPLATSKNGLLQLMSLHPANAASEWTDQQVNFCLISHLQGRLASMVTAVI